MSIWVPAAVGLAFGLQFNLVTGVIGSCVASAVATYQRDLRAWAFAGLILAAAWAFGELSTRMAVTTSLQGRSGQIAAIVQMIVSAGVGYVAPTLVGRYVGRHVRRGLGWPAAIGVALALVLALSVIGGAVADAVFARLPAGVVYS